MLKKILAVVAGLIVIFVVVVMAQPSEYHVERTTEMAAPADLVWAEIADFGQWKNWSHWDKSDPSQKTTVTGEPGAVGHTSSWDGEKTGSGIMKITGAKKPTRLDLELVFKTPMEGVATSAFVLVPKGDKTEVTLSMDGENGFMGKLFAMFMDMDDMIGSAYEDSLASIQEIAETKAREQAVAAAPGDETASPDDETASPDDETASPDDETTE